MFRFLLLLMLLLNEFKWENIRRNRPTSSKTASQCSIQPSLIVSTNKLCAQGLFLPLLYVRLNPFLSYSTIIPVLVVTPICKSEKL